MNKTVNFVGQKIDELTIIKRLPNNKHGQAVWECKCSCEKILSVSSVNLNHKTKLYPRCCGCKKLNGRWTGYKGLSGTYWCAIKRRAKVAKLKLTVTTKFLWELYLKQNKKCALSGIEIYLKSNDFKDLGKKQTASLDRKDSSKGYTPDNVQWIYKPINFMKRDMIESEFIYLCQKISEEQNDRKSP